MNLYIMQEQAHELIRTRCGQGQLIITDTAVIIEFRLLGRRDVLMRSALTGVDVKRVLFTAANITFYGQGKTMRATTVKAKDAKRIQALLLGL